MSLRNEMGPAAWRVCRSGRQLGVGELVAYLLAPAALTLLILAAACGDGDLRRSPAPSVDHSPSPTISRGGTPSPTPRQPLEQLAFVGPEGEIRLVNADGSGHRVLAPLACAGEASAFDLTWSPDGSRLAYVCRSADLTRHVLVVLNDSGKVIVQIPGAARFRWSPDSTRIAYQSDAYIGDKPLYEVSVVDAVSGGRLQVFEDAWLLDWAGAQSLLIGFGPQSGFLVIRFQANLVDLASGGMRVVPRLHDAGDFWVLPDGGSLVVLGEWSEEARGVSMALFDLESGNETPLPGAYIGYPSEHIPDNQLAFHPDGGGAYWLNPNLGPPVLWTISFDGSEARRVGETEAIGAAVSPNGRLAYVGFANGEPASLVIEDPLIGTRIEVGPPGPKSEGAWRPMPRQ